MFKEPKTQLGEPISFRKHMPVGDDTVHKLTKAQFGPKTTSLFIDKKVTPFKYITS